MRSMSGINIIDNINLFLDGDGEKIKGRYKEERFASFDYCFNYFQSFRKRNCIEKLCNPENMQQSCLQIAFFLASWGMFRGASFLLQKSVKFYSHLIEKIIETEASRLWTIDLPYKNDDIDLLIKTKENFQKALEKRPSQIPSQTLVTKIMLGVYGNVPAFDNYFQKGMNVCKFTANNLKKISDFYLKYKEEIDNYEPIYTLDFHTGKPTTLKYTNAKIVDMVGWIQGRTLQ
jgi:hypothetical protein